MTTPSATKELSRPSGSSLRVDAMKRGWPGCARKKSKVPSRILRAISNRLVQKKPISRRWISMAVPTSSVIS